MDNSILAVVAKPSSKPGEQQHSFAEAGHSGDGTEGEMNFHSVLASDTESAERSKPTTAAQPEIKDVRITRDPDDKEGARRSHRVNEAYSFVLARSSAPEGEGEGDDLSPSIPIREIGLDPNMNTLQAGSDAEARDDASGNALDLAPTPDSMPQPITALTSAERVEVSAVVERSPGVARGSVSGVSQPLAVETSGERIEISTVLNRSLVASPGSVNDGSRPPAIQALAGGSEVGALSDRSSVVVAPGTLNAISTPEVLTDLSTPPGEIARSALTHSIAASASEATPYRPRRAGPKPEIPNPALLGVEKFRSEREASQAAAITDTGSAAPAPETQVASPGHAPLSDGVLSITPPDAGNGAARGHSAQSIVPTRVSVADPRWGQEFGSHMVWMAGKRLQSASLQITPPDLGPVNVQLRLHEENQASISFSSHHAVVREALEAALPKLRELFTEGGLQLLEVEISDRGGTRHHWEDRPWQRAADHLREQEKTISFTEASVAATSGRSHQGLLDTFA